MTDPTKHRDLDQPNIKASGHDRYTQLEGYASTFGNVDRGGDIVVKGAFTKTIREAVKRGNVPLMDGHEHRSPRAIIGTLTHAQEDDHGLWIRARLSNEFRAQQVARLVNEGHARKMSIGYNVVKAHQGTIGDEPVTYLDEVKLLEVSVVGIPMNDEATITSVKDTSSTGEPLAEQLDVVRAAYNTDKLTEWARATNPELWHQVSGDPHAGKMLETATLTGETTALEWQLDQDQARKAAAEHYNATLEHLRQLDRAGRVRTLAERYGRDMATYLDSVLHP